VKVLTTDGVGLADAASTATPVVIANETAVSPPKTNAAANRARELPRDDYPWINPFRSEDANYSPA
jgi:hypothetical protein